MRSVLGVVCAVSCLAGCGGDATGETDVEFANHHLWKVGNCEVGTLTPFDPVTGDAEGCGNARQLSECVGNNLFTFTIRGMDVTFSKTIDGTTVSANAQLERSLDCAKETALEPASCNRMNAALAQDEKLFVMRDVDHAEEKLSGDDLWAIKDAPWPATEACRAAVSR